MLLTDEEMSAAIGFVTDLPTSYRRVEAAVLAKLRGQEPVAVVERYEHRWPREGHFYNDPTFLDDVELPEGTKLFTNPVPMTEVEAKYNELLMAVAKKFPNETRHETALKYIRTIEALKGQL